MSRTVALHGWLEQGDADPFEGRPAVDAVLKEALGLAALRVTRAVGFSPEHIRPTRLSTAALAMLRAAAGEGAVDLDPEQRARASVGQGYLDVLARRAGQIDAPVDAVVRPKDHATALSVLRWCDDQGVKVQAMGGATGVVGGFEATGDPVRIALSTARLNKVVAISATDLTARAEAGVRLPDLDQALAGHGLMFGHQPQSYHGVTLGGAIAAHGAGQRSNGFGRMADLLVNARLATPVGTWDTETLREAASGPWLGGLVTGSEGAFGLITEATVRVVPCPEVSAEVGFLFERFTDAVGVVRTLVQSGVPLSMVRVSDAEETATLGRFARARRDPKPSDWLIDQWLKWRGAPATPSLLLVGVDADRSTARAVFAAARGAARGAISLGAAAGRSWRRGRFEAPYWREGLMNRGLGVETLETALPWSRLIEAHATIKSALAEALSATMPAGRPLVLCHLSHAYREAASLYFTLVFPRDPDDPKAQWRSVKAIANATLAGLGAAPSHHHGMGSDHADLLASAKDPTSRALISALRRTLDPNGILIAPGFDQGS